MIKLRARSVVILFPLFIFSVFVLSSAKASDDLVKQSDIEEMVIGGIAFDKITGTPVVILSGGEKSKKMLPVWIGLCEARAIELGSTEAVAPRPMTYDLVAAIVRTLEAKIERIVIVDLRDNVYYAEVQLSVNGKTKVIDARPSDAIALALRMSAPIFVKKSVLDKSPLVDFGQPKKGI